MRRGKPSRLAARLRDTDFSIMTQYQAEYRGLVQYYLLAFNVHRLWRFHRVMELSLVHTLTDKFKTSVKRIYRKYRKTVEVPHGTHKVLEVIVDRGPKKKPLVARFGGIELRWQKHAILDDHPKEVSSARSEVVQRLLAQPQMRTVRHRGTLSGPPRPQVGRSEPTRTGGEATLDQTHGGSPPQDPGRLSKVPRGHSSRATEAAPVRRIDHWRAA